MRRSEAIGKPLQNVAVVPPTERPWAPTIAGTAGPIYKAIVEALSKDIESGALRPGAPLPSQRDLAASLGINFTTVTRAYDEARQKGLITAHAGQGTFVRAPSQDRTPGRPSLRAVIDLGSNWPPSVPAMDGLPSLLGTRLSTLGPDALESRGGPADVADVMAGVAWLRPAFPADIADRLLITAGTRLAIFAAMSLLRHDNAPVLTEGLGWPAIKALAQLLGMKLHGLGMDDQGVRPDAFDDACRATGSRLLYCVPNVQNPTTRTMGLERREDLAAVARRHGATIVEDDAYGRIPRKLPPPIAAIAPDVAIYVTGLSKCVLPGLRVAYLLARDVREAQRLGEILRLTMLSAPPLELRLATTAIQCGVARTIGDEIRDAMVERASILKRTVPAAIVAPGALHGWLPLPESWPRAEFIAEAARRGIRVVPSDAFAVAPYAAENAVRLSIGGVSSTADLARGLADLAEILDSSPSFAGNIT